jgi:hypothetical protein
MPLTLSNSAAVALLASTAAKEILMAAKNAPKANNTRFIIYPFINMMVGLPR